MRKILWLGFAVWAAVPLLAAEKPHDVWGDLLRSYGITAKVQPGAWAAYRMQMTEAQEKPEAVQWKMACVGSEKVGDKEGMWLEMESTVLSEDKEPMRMIVKSLVVGDPSQEQSVHKIIMQLGDQPPMLMKVAFDSLTEESEPPVAAVIGDETVTVPAGTFLCKHLRSTMSEGEVSDIYLNQEVSLFGVVKVRTSDGEIELVSHGATGAVSQIRGEPAMELDMQRMMQEMMKPAPAESLPKPK
ncbi:MAG: hypothetical protein V1784_03990 [bacterium]